MLGLRQQQQQQQQQQQIGPQLHMQKPGSQVLSGSNRISGCFTWL
jgi:hypothetical protein